MGSFHVQQLGISCGIHLEVHEALSTPVTRKLAISWRGRGWHSLQHLSSGWTAPMKDMHKTGMKRDMNDSKLPPKKRPMIMHQVPSIRGKSPEEEPHAKESKGSVSTSGTPRQSKTVRTATTNLTLLAESRKVIPGRSRSVRSPSTNPPLPAEATIPIPGPRLLAPSRDLRTPTTNPEPRRVTRRKARSVRSPNSNPPIPAQPRISNASPAEATIPISGPPLLAASTGLKTPTLRPTRRRTVGASSTDDNSEKSSKRTHASSSTPKK